MLVLSAVTLIQTVFFITFLLFWKCKHNFILYETQRSSIVEGGVPFVDHKAVLGAVLILWKSTLNPRKSARIQNLCPRTSFLPWGCDVTTIKHHQHSPGCKNTSRADAESAWTVYAQACGSWAIIAHWAIREEGLTHVLMMCFWTSKDVNMF